MGVPKPHGMYLARICRPSLIGTLLVMLVLAAGCNMDLDAPLGDSPRVTPGWISSSGTGTTTSAQPASTTAPAQITVSQAEDNGTDKVIVSIDTTLHSPISPWIYGVAESSSGNEDLLRSLGVTLVRWGGNARTRHNWEINASNAGSDWEFRNVGQGDDVPGSASILYLQRNQRLNALSLLTIPMIGWVAKDKNNDSMSTAMPQHGGPPVTAGSDSAFTEFKNGQWTKPYDPTANRDRTSIKSLPTKGSAFSYPPDLNDGKVYQDEWVHYMRTSRPRGALPPIYAMDNEPELWSDDTHVDVHPVRLGYDDQLNLFLKYAAAVKKADPEGLVAAPESWGVIAYGYSALDEGGDTYRKAADRAAHGDVPFLEWFLRNAQEHDKAAGSRLLDILDVHYYPNSGVYGGGNKPDMQEKRVQATRALWDASFVEPSWVAQTEWANLALIPRLKKIVQDNYPGTKIGISEWNFGGEDDISGAIAIADTLGIFGRENVYSAAYWGLPKLDTPASWAFRLYRNYDGHGATFGTESVQTLSSNDRSLASYGALSSDGSKLTIMLINKDQNAAMHMGFNIKGFEAKSTNQFTYSRSDLSSITTQTFDGQQSPLDGLTIPPLTIKLLVLTKGAN